MTAEQREQFELIVEFNDELRQFAGALAEVGTAVMLATLRRGGEAPSPATKTRILDAIVDHPRQTKSEALVMSGPDGLVNGLIRPSASCVDIRSKNCGEKSWDRFYKAREPIVKRRAGCGALCTNTGLAARSFSTTTKTELLIGSR